MRTTKWFLGTALAVSMLASGILQFGFARADVIDYSTSGLDGAQTVNGDAVFKLNGSTLEIDLTNNTTSANMQGTADLLTAVKFDLAGMTLSNGSATGQTVSVNNDLTLTTPSATELLDNGWGGGSLSGDPNEYVAAAGLNLGNGKSFDGTNLDGAGYGVIPAISAVGNKDGFPQSGPYTYGTATLTFTVTGTGTLANDLSNVTFLWGTTPDATIPSNHVVVVVPEPTGLMAVALLFGALARRRGRATAK